jgi:hypothetical protein
LYVLDDARSGAVDLANAAKIKNYRARLLSSRSCNLVNESLTGAEEQRALQLHD